MKLAAVFIILSLALLLYIGETEARPGGQAGISCSYPSGILPCRPDGDPEVWKEYLKRAAKEAERSAKKVGKEAERLGKKAKKWFG
jgi:hypothetical protein